MIFINFLFKRNRRISSFLKDFISLSLCFIVLLSIISISFIPVIDAKTTDDKKIKDNPSVEKKVDNPSVEKKVDTSLKKKTSKELKIITNIKIIDNHKPKRDNIKLRMESEVGNISKNNSISALIAFYEETKTTIKQVDFIPSANHNNVKLVISDLKSKPTDIVHELNMSEKSTIYKYLDIKLTADEEYIGESGISSMTFTFTVEKTWIKNQYLDKHSIKMMRYHNDSWQELNTTLIHETSDMIYYEASTPGLSVFAVIGDTIIEESDAIVDDSIPIPWWMSIGVIITSFVFICIFIVKKRFIYSK